MCLGKVTASRLIRAAVVFSLVVGSASLFAAAKAAAETRSLKIFHVHTRERAIIAYKKDGRYLPDGLKKLDYILRDWRRNEPTKMDPRLFDLLWEVYRKSGSHDYINIICGYRAPATNAMLRSRSRGVAKQSQHMLGKAIDFFIPDVPLKKLRYIGLKIEAGGVGYYPRSGSPFVHMDVATPRYWPRMSRQELIALFPNGNTMYVPSDGKPLPGYQQAVAAYEARKASGSSIQIASASSGRKRTLLEALFGSNDGGIEEAEDNADNGVVPAQPAQDAAPATAVADAASALPRVAPVVPSPRPVVVAEAASGEAPAALAAMSSPPALPTAPSAPEVRRPDADLVQVASVAPANEAAAAQPTLAFAVPIPGQRPDRPLDIGNPDADGASSPAVVAALVPRERPDRMAIFIGRALAGEMDNGRAPTTANAPSSKPALASGDAGRGDNLPSPAGRLQIAGARAHGQGGEVRVASLSPSSPRSTLLAAANGADPVAAIGTGVHTAAKDARVVPDDAMLAPDSDIVPVAERRISGRVFSGRRVADTTIASKRPKRYDAAMLTAPTVVYVAGFERHPDMARYDAFSGAAVSFFSVAKFASLD